MESDFDSLNAKITAEQKQLDRERLAGEKTPEEITKKSDKNDDLMNAFTNHIRIGSQRTGEIYAALQQDNPNTGRFPCRP